MASFTSSSLKMGKLIFMWAPVSQHHLLHWECWEPLTCLTVTTLMRLSTPNSYCSQIGNLGKVRVVKVISAPGSFYVNHSLGLSVACRVMVDGQNWYLQGSLFRENLLDGGIWAVVGSKDASMVAPALLPLSGILWQPGQLFISLLV